MRFAYPWMTSMIVIVACGTATPATETDADETSSTTWMVTSNDGENTTVPFTTDDSSSSSSSVDTGTTSSTTSESSEGTEGTSSSDTSSSDGSSSDGSSSESGSESSTTEPVLPACAAGCEVEFECGEGEWKSAEACTNWCEANLIKAAEFSQFCAQAWENLSACFAELTCDEYAEYLAPTMFPYPCAIESDSLMFECKGQ